MNLTQQLENKKRGYGAIVELFCGTKSFTKEAEKLGYKCFTIDFNKKFNPDLVKDILELTIEDLPEEFRNPTIVWASPPCQTHSKMRYLASKRGSYQAKIPDMSIYSQILFLQHFCKDKKWVVENVVPYYKPLIEPTIKLDRHLFWSNFKIDFKEFAKPETKHNKVTGKTNRFGISLDGIKIKHRKDQIIRNCVNPELGLHILEQLNQPKTEKWGKIK